MSKLPRFEERNRRGTNPFSLSRVAYLLFLRDQHEQNDYLDYHHRIRILATIFPLAVAVVMVVEVTVKYFCTRGRAEQVFPSLNRRPLGRLGRPWRRSMKNDTGYVVATQPTCQCYLELLWGDGGDKDGSF